MGEPVSHLGYLSLEQLREYAVRTNASTDESHARMLATNAFRKPLREYLWGCDKSEAVTRLEETIQAPATLDHSEMGILINLGILKAALESGKLSEKRPSRYGWAEEQLPPILGEKALDLLSGYIEEREQFLGIQKPTLQ